MEFASFRVTRNKRNTPLHSNNFQASSGCKLDYSYQHLFSYNVHGESQFLELSLPINSKGSQITLYN